MDANEIGKLVMEYIRLNQPDALESAELAERIARAFLAGMKAERGYVTVEAR